MSDMNNPSDENNGAVDDLWADALNEQKAAPAAKTAADAVFQQLGGSEVGGNLHEAGKKGTQQGRYFLKTPVAESKCATQQHGDEGSGQGLGTGGKYPCP